MLRTSSLSSDVDSRPAFQRQESSASQIHHNSHSANVLEQLNALRHEESLTDIYLQTDDGQGFACHRVILAATCDYFRAMFSSRMKESTSEHVLIKNISGSILSQIIEYCYTGSILLTDDNIKEILEAADYLRFKAVGKECAQFLENRLDATNCLETEQVARRVFNRQLSKQAHLYSVGNFTDVTFSSEFLEFTQDEMEEFISKDLCVDCEEEVYEAIMRWVKHDKEDRKSAVSSLLEKIIFELMSKSYVFDIAAREALLQEHKDFMKIIKKARSFHLANRNLNNTSLSNIHTELASRAQSVRNFSEVMILIGDLEFRNQAEGLSPKSSNVLLYNPKNDKWDELPGSPFQSSFEFSTAATHVNNDVIILTSQHRAWQYIIGENKWSLLTNRMERRNGGCLVTHKNEAFILGGLRPVDTSYMTSVQYLNPVTKQWLDVAPLISGLIHTTAVDCLDKIFIIGSTGSRFVSEMYCYSSLSNDWVSCSPVPQRLMRPKMVAINGSLYILGHLDDFTMAMLQYEVISQKWTNMDAPMITRQGASVAVCNNKLYLFGGKVFSPDYQEADEFTIECYDPNTEMWGIHGESPWILNGHQTVTVLNPNFPPADYIGPKKH